MKKLTFILTIVFLLGPNLLSAQPSHRGKDNQERNNFRQILNLTSEQEVKMNSEKIRFQKQILDYRNKIQNYRLDIKEMMLGNQFDEQKFLKLNEDILKTETELKMERNKHWLNVYKMLDSDQQKSWIKNYGNLKKHLREGIAQKDCCKGNKRMKRESKN
ncbi:MAG: periplasmic heavy metal sensor [Melioribacteraceae bacterium]|jgi:Spy/CpxP family protein refolding chaperone|nr:periplasmic heavy metal sensor [Melioribacteraceae bacterium]